MGRGWLPWWTSGKESIHNAETQETPVLALSLGGEDSPGGGHGNPLDCSFQENPMDRGAWRVSVHGATKESDTTDATEQQQSQADVMSIDFRPSLFSFGI